VGAAVAVLAFPPAIGTQVAVSRYALSESTADASLEQVAAEVLPSVVTLTTDLGGGALMEGSGIVLSPDGLIMTNAHVVAAAGDAPQGPASTVVALNDGRTARFSVVAADTSSDIAVVRAEGMSGLTAISLGSSTDLRVGQPVLAVDLRSVCRAPSPVASSARSTVLCSTPSATTIRRPRSTLFKQMPRSTRATRAARWLT